MSVFITGAGIIPSTIKYVEYLESTGTQFINTGFKPNQNTRIVMDMVCVGSLSEVMLHYGSTNAGESPMFMSGKASTLNWKFVAYYNTAYAQDTTVTEAETKTRGVIDQNKNVCTWGRVGLSITAGTFQIQYPVYLFGVNAAGSLKYASKMRLYSCQIYDNGTLIRDFWPCYDPEGVACLYDKVSETYFYNAGSGSFTAGGAA